MHLTCLNKGCIQDWSIAHYINKKMNQKTVQVCSTMRMHLQ